MEPKISLRKVQYAAFASQETECFSAIVVVDGKDFCGVSNDGHGGPDFNEPLKGQTMTQLEAAIGDLAKRINPLAYDRRASVTIKANYDLDFEGEWWKRGQHSADTIFECVVGRALTRHLEGKRLARILKKKLLVLTESGKLWTYGNTSKDLVKLREAVKVRQREQGDPVSKVLNDLPIDEAVEILLAHAERG